MQLIASHVLFPNEADWSQRPSWRRAWQTTIADAVTGHESRTALRAVARETISFTITPGSHTEQAQLDDAIRAAKKSGLACAPFWGRGCVITGEASGDTIECGPGWSWAVGDSAFFLAQDGSYEIGTVASAVFEDGVWTVGLVSALAGSFTGFVRPLIFGKFTCDKMPAMTPTTGPARISIAQMTSPASAPIGAVEPDNAEGIGHNWSIAGTFEVQ